MKIVTAIAGTLLLSLFLVPALPAAEGNSSSHLDGIELHILAGHERDPFADINWDCGWGFWAVAENKQTKAVSGYWNFSYYKGGWIRENCSFHLSPFESTAVGRTCWYIFPLHPTPIKITISAGNKTMTRTGINAWGLVIFQHTEKSWE